MMRHILSAHQFEESDLKKIFDITDEIKKHPYRWKSALSGKLMGTLFFEPSTRTRWSSEAAMLRLGGQTISMPFAASSSTVKGESLADTVKNCSQLVDILVIRHPEANSVQEVAKYSDVPVINGGDGANEHPTQALLDFYTIKQYFPDLKGKKLLFTGDLAHSRTVNSLTKLLKDVEVCYGIAKNPLMSKFDILTKMLRYTEEHALKQGVVKHNPTCGIWEEDIPDLLDTFDIVYMTRCQKERHIGELKPISEFIMTKELAEIMKKDAIIMHPGPRNHEISPDVDTDHRAVYYEQTKNGMWTRMALLWDLLGEHHK